jgi:protein required for attachment to host cells
MRTATTRIFIVSGGAARWVERARDGNELVTLGELAPTSAHTPQGPRNGAFGHEPGQHRGPGDRHDAARRRELFAREVAETINHQHARGEFERLGLVAPARLLRVIREHLVDGARTKLRFELPKDLSKHANHALRAWLHNPEFA